jgi:hypothetical protein
MSVIISFTGLVLPCVVLSFMNSLRFLAHTCLLTQGIELLMRYFVGTELGVANLLQRHFNWSSNSLWCEEIPDAYNPEKTLFVLGGKDDIINAKVSTAFPSSFH